MEQQQQLNELKTRLATLQGQEPIKPEQSPLSDEAIVRRAFALMPSTIEEINAAEDERVDAEKAVRKACPECYHCQPVANEACALCGVTPEHWLQSLLRRPRTNRQGDIVDRDGAVLVPLSKAVGAEARAIAEQNWLRWAATDATVGLLQWTVAKSGSPDDKGRVKHAARILRLRGESVPPTLYGDAA